MGAAYASRYRRPTTERTYRTARTHLRFTPAVGCKERSRYGLAACRLTFLGRLGQGLDVVQDRVERYFERLSLALELGQQQAALQSGERRER